MFENFSVVTEQTVKQEPYLPTVKELIASMEHGSWAVLMFIMTLGYFSRGRVTRFFVSILETQQAIKESQYRILMILERLEKIVDRT